MVTPFSTSAATMSSMPPSSEMSKISAGWAYGQLPLLSSVAFGGGLLGTLALVTFHRRPKPALA